MGIFKLNGIDYMGGGGGGNANERVLTWAEYCALTEEEKTNGTTYYINDINGESKDQFQPIIYSEEEREIGVWTDGRPLYQTTIYLGNLSQDSSWHNVAHNIADIDKIINCVGRVQDSTMVYVIPNYRAAMSLGITLGADATTITYMNNWISATDCYITLQYTKTTDQPGSGTWTPQGVPAVHYSTDEHVIGTWIDGSTLYEKTFITSTINNTTLDIDLGFAISMGVVVHGYYLLNDTNGSMISANQWFASSNFSWTHIELNTHLLKCHLTGYTGVGYITIRYTKTT